MEVDIIKQKTNKQKLYPWQDPKGRIVETAFSTVASQEEARQRLHVAFAKEEKVSSYIYVYDI